MPLVGADGFALPLHPGGVLPKYGFHGFQWCRSLLSTFAKIALILNGPMAALIHL